MGQSKPIGRESILIVEDEAILRFDMVDFFEDRGWDVLEADSARRAIDILDQRDDIRVVITDVSMPGEIDGLKLAHYVRKRFPPTLLYVMSAHQPVRDADLPGQAVFVPKPFDFHKLAKRIEAQATN